MISNIRTRVRILRFNIREYRIYARGYLDQRFAPAYNSRASKYSRIFVRAYSRAVAASR